MGTVAGTSRDETRRSLWWALVALCCVTATVAGVSAQAPSSPVEVTAASRAQMASAWRALSDEPGDVDVRLVFDEDFRFVWLGAGDNGPTLCERECTLHLARGAYRFGLRVITGPRVLRERTVLVGSPGVLRGEYHSPAPWRIAAGVTLGVTQLTAAIILVNTFCIDLFGSGSCPDRTPEQLGALAISLVGIAVAIVLFVKSLRPLRIRFEPRSTRPARARAQGRRRW